MRSSSASPSRSRKSARRFRNAWKPKNRPKKNNFIGEVIMEFEKLQSIIADVMSVDADEITMETTFKEDLGADSLDVL